MNSQPWFVGAWRRRSIEVPGVAPTEPCEAWWVQGPEIFVDVRAEVSEGRGSGLPYSSTRAFGGRFGLVPGGCRWHVELDSGGPTPRTDGAAGVDLSVDPSDPMVMIEDAPERFREVWVRPDIAPRGRGIILAHLIAVQVGDVFAAVWSSGVDGRVSGRVWTGDWSVGVGAFDESVPDLDAWVDE